MKIGDHTIDNPVILAPMAAITNPPFRQICLQLGAGLAGSEVLSASQLIQPNKTVPIQRCASEKTLVVQLYGRIPKEVAQGARVALDHGADVIDINMGCPARKVVKQGAGVCLMLEPDLARIITRAVVDAVDVPVTVKMRSGYSSKNINAPEVARAVVDAGACAVTIHARTREAVHTGPYDWSVIKKVRDSLHHTIPVTGNGGITSPEDAQKMRDETGCDAIMVGRATRGNPWIFKSITEKTQFRPDMDERKRVILRHLDLYVKWGGEDRAVLEMRKHLVWYLRGIRGATKIRASLGRLRSQQDIIDLVSDIEDILPPQPE